MTYINVAEIRKQGGEVSTDKSGVTTITGISSTPITVPTNANVVTGGYTGNQDASYNSEGQINPAISIQTDKTVTSLQVQKPVEQQKTTTPSSQPSYTGLSIPALAGVGQNVSYANPTITQVSQTNNQGIAGFEDALRKQSFQTKVKEVQAEEGQRQEAISKIVRTQNDKQKTQGTLTEYKEPNPQESKYFFSRIEKPNAYYKSEQGLLFGLQLPAKGVSTIGEFIGSGYNYLSGKERQLVYNYAKPLFPTYIKAESIKQPIMSYTGDLLSNFAQVGTYVLNPIYGTTRFITEIVATSGKAVTGIVTSPIEKIKKGDIRGASLDIATIGFGFKAGSKAYELRKGTTFENPEINPTIKTWGTSTIFSDTSVPTIRESLKIGTEPFFSLVSDKLATSISGIKNKFTPQQTEALKLGIITNIKAVALSKLSKLDMTPVLTKETINALPESTLQKTLIPTSKSEGALAGSIGEQTYIRGSKESSLRPTTDIDVITTGQRQIGTLKPPINPTDTSINSMIRLSGQYDFFNKAIDTNKLIEIDKTITNSKIQADITGLEPSKAIIVEKGIKYGAEFKGSTAEILTGFSLVKKGNLELEQFNNMFKGKAEVTREGSLNFLKEMTDIDYQFKTPNKARLSAIETLQELNKAEPNRYTLEFIKFGTKGSKVDVLLKEGEQAPVYSYLEQTSNKNYYDISSVTRIVQELDVTGKVTKESIVRLPMKKQAESLEIFRIKDTKAVEGTESYIGDFSYPSKLFERYQRENKVVTGGRLKTKGSLQSESPNTLFINNQKVYVQKFSSIIKDKLDIISQSGDKSLKQSSKILNYNIIKKDFNVKYDVASQKGLAVKHATILDSMKNILNVQEGFRIREKSTKATEGISDVLLQEQSKIGTKGYKPIKLGQFLSPEYQLSAKGQTLKGVALEKTRTYDTNQLKIEDTTQTTKLLGTNKHSIQVVHFKQLLDQSVFRKIAGGESVKDLGRIDILKDIVNRSKEQVAKEEVTGFRAKQVLKLGEQVLKDIEMEQGKISSTRKISGIEIGLGKISLINPTLLKEVFTKSKENSPIQLKSNEQSKALTTQYKELSKETELAINEKILQVNIRQGYVEKGKSLIKSYPQQFNNKQLQEVKPQSRSIKTNYELETNYPSIKISYKEAPKEYKTYTKEYIKNYPTNYKYTSNKNNYQNYIAQETYSTIQTYKELKYPTNIKPTDYVSKTKDYIKTSPYQNYQRTTNSQINYPKTNKINIPFKPITKLENTNQNTIFEKLFDVEIGRKGKTKIYEYKKGLTFEQAKGYLTSKLKSNLSASGSIQYEGKKINLGNVGEEFYTSSRTGRLVQKRKFRLSSSEEKRQIQQYKGGMAI